jgi:putative heme-binding domain-containing protein
MLNSKRIVPAGYRLATATTAGGASVEGIVRNEDNFSVQLQSRDGSFHFFQKSELQKLEYRNESLMPTDYGKRLSRDELNDLVSYLMSAGSSGKARATEAKKEGQ